MDLGAFSISLAVADLARSRDFYRALGFEETGGSFDENWLIMVNGRSVVGLFHEMFDDNILTFNPGMDPVDGEVDIVDDVRDIQARLKAAGIELEMEVDPDSAGAGHIVLVDPDGNRIMVDQFR